MSASELAGSQEITYSGLSLTRMCSAGAPAPAPAQPSHRPGAAPALLTTLCGFAPADNPCNALGYCFRCLTEFPDTCEPARVCPPRGSANARRSTNLRL